MLKGDKTWVQSAPDELIELCDDAKCIHESLPCGQREKHET